MKAPKKKHEINTKIVTIFLKITQAKEYFFCHLPSFVVVVRFCFCFFWFIGSFSFVLKPHFLILSFAAVAP